MLAAPVVAAAAYLLAHCVAAILPCRQRSAIQSGPALRFAIVIPAHNEETGLPSTLAACRRLDYLPSAVRVFVIADNCTDSTASVARQAGATVLERREPAHRGKGYALAWGLPWVLLEPVEAVVVVDADCVPDANLLGAVSARMSGGARAVQTAVVV